MASRLVRQIEYMTQENLVKGKLQGDLKMKVTWRPSAHFLSAANRGLKPNPGDSICPCSLSSVAELGVSEVIWEKESWRSRKQISKGIHRKQHKYLATQNQQIVMPKRKEESLKLP
jgi:hypothetical protein